MGRLRSGTLALGLAGATAVGAAGCGAGPATPPLPAAPTRVELSAPWVEATPAEVGMDAQLLAAAPAAAGTVPRFRSLLAARRGRLVLERYFGGADARTLSDVRSVTKSVVGALVGIALRERPTAGLDTPIGAYLGPPYVLDDADRALTLRHLLTMTSGFEWNEEPGGDYNLWIAADDHVQYLLDRPHLRAPGAQFAYNSAAVHLLGVVLERLTATPLSQYSADRLFVPLGIETARWEPLEGGTVNGGSGIALRGRDLLKFGQLFLQRGWSADRSVVPESWVEEATRPRFTWRMNMGTQRSVTYGMLWWVSDAGPAAFFAWGYGGQFVYVVPERELVVVATTDWRQPSETTPRALAEEVLRVIVGLAAAAR